MRLSSPVSGSVMDFDPFEVRTEADSSHQYGSLVATNDNACFRYGKAGEATTLGKLKQAPSPKANHANRQINGATAIGATSVSIDLGATAAVVGEYDEGWLVINDSTGEGQTLSISHNPAADSDADTTIQLNDAVQIALVDNTSEGTLVHNTYNAFHEVASKTLRGAGVSLVDIGDGDYGWLKTRGVAGTLIGSAATLGAPLSSDGSTAGAVTDNTDVTAPQAEIIVGQASIVAGVTGEYNPIVVCID